MNPCRRQPLGLVLTILALFPPLAVQAATSVSGNVYDGAGGPWTQAGSPYVVTADVTVPAGQTLTIQAGVVVKFVYGSTDLIVNGTLNADAEPTAKVIFTADRDDTAGGDTNGDGNSSSPHINLWGCLHFMSSSSASVLDYVEVRYGGWATDGGVWIDGGQARVTNSLLRDIDGAGIRVESSTPTLTGNTYANNTWAAVSMDLASDPVISGSTVTNNRINGLALNSGALVGNRVWDDADMVHVFFGDIIVPAGQTLTLAPGLIVKVEYGSNDLIVNGTLLAEGTVGAPIRVTPLRDDTIGGDTENDGATTPAIGLWGSVVLSDTSTGSRMSHVEVRYGGWGGRGNILVAGGQLTLTDSTLKSADGAGIRIQQSDVVLTDNTYETNTGAAVSMDLASDPDVHGVTLSGNGTNGLVLDSGTLARSLPWDDPDIVYAFFGDITVPAGLVLSIAANQVVKVGYGGTDLLINGTLVAAGTAGASVEFTAYPDDSVGGDTNSNAAADAPFRGYWGGLRFGPGSMDNALQHCRVSYGGWTSAGGIVIDQADVAMTDCAVRQSSQSGVRIAGAAPALQNTVFEANDASAVSMDLASNPDIDGVTLTNNGVNGLTLDSGTMPGDGSWDDPDITYRMSGDVIVPAGGTLLVAPGQVVKAAYGSFDLIVTGTLLAQGTADAPIVFTSERDDTVGGDTNNNAASDGPFAGIWNGLWFDASSTGSVLDHVEVRYGGWSNLGAVWVRGGQLRMTHSTVYRSARYGLRLEGSNPTLLDNRFELNGWSALAMDLASDPDLQGVMLVSNGNNSLTLDGGVLPGDAHWDDPDITYLMSGDVTVPPGLVLTLAPGQVVKVAYGSHDLIVQGTLLAAGTTEAPVVFTSERDDSVGGDTNNNGAANGPYPGIWGHLRFESTATGNVLTNVSVFYPGWGATGGIALDGADAGLTDCTVSGASVYGMRLQSCAPQLTRATFDANAWAAISADLAATPAIDGVTLTQNGQNGLRLDGGTLPGDAVWDDTDIVHILSGDVTVPAGTTLTLVPGLIVKAQYASIDLQVDGTLLAEGTVDAPIVITSDRDDSVGGDTNNSTAGPYRGIWGGLILRSSSVGSVLACVDIRYGGWATDAEVLLDGCSARLRNSVVTQSGSSGIGVRNNAGIDIENTIVAENSYSGLFAVTGSVATVFNSTLDRNSTGVHTDAATASVTNCLITRNTSSGLYRAGTSALTVRYCDAYNPGSSYGDYRNLPSQTGQNGNLSADPLYAGKGVLAYGLQEGSPAIDAATSVGAPTRDFLGWLRFDDPAVPNVEPGLRGYYDMGALEYGGLAPLDIDLATSNVTGPTVGTQNGTVQVTWEVSNTGTDDAVGAWYDAVYLSCDGTLSADDRLIGSLQHSDGLQAGHSYTAVLDADLQGVVPGNLHFIVVTDARHETLEGGSHANNTSATATTASFTMPRLTLGTPAPGAFAVVGDLQYYQVAVPTGSNLLVTLDDDDNVGTNELYVSRATPPSVDSAQFSATGGPDGTVSAAAAAAGNWYILVHNAFGTGGYTLLAQVTHLGLHSVTPEAWGNTTEMALQVQGAGFGPNTQARLVADGGTEYTGAVEVDSFSQMTVTFGAGTLPPGIYAVDVRDGISAETASLPDAVTILAGGTGVLETNVLVPSVLGYHGLGTIYVEYTNAGDVAIQAPLLILRVLQKGREAALLTLDSSRVSSGFWTSAVPQGFNASVAFLASGASGGILQAGESGRVPVYWAGWLQPWDFAYPPFEFKLYAMDSYSGVPIDWAAFKEPSRPPEIEPAAWDLIWSTFTGRAGTTYGSYVAMLDANAMHLDRYGPSETDVGRLLGFELLKAYGLSPVQVLAAAMDSSVRGGGLPMVVHRLYPQGLAQRHRLGPFGRGWVHSWDKSLEVRGDGTVLIASSGTIYAFQPDTRGGYLPPEGYRAALTKSGADYWLREHASGVTFRFSGALLTSVSDTRGNAIALAYTAGLLTGLANNYGQSTTLSYTAQGRISQITNSDGDTVSYAYDPAEELLLSATNQHGQTVLYTYSVGGPAAWERALTEITYPDGTNQRYQYDANGRLAGARLEGGVDTMELTYDANGSATMTNKLGGRSRFIYGRDGSVAKAELPQVIHTTYSADGLITAIGTSDGATHSLDHDSMGNLSRWTDPLGAIRSFTYDRRGNLTRFVDPRGSATLFGRDTSGNLVSITQPNGVTEHFYHDASGNVTAHTNGRGQTVGVVLSPQGRPAQLSIPGTGTVTYAFNPLNRVIEADAPAGKTIISYDTDDRVSMVLYPDGKSLAYTYDALGRRTSMQDHLGNLTQYAYDALGRLTTLRDGAGDLITAFTFGDGNVVTRKELGNGARAEYQYDAWMRPISVTNHNPAGTVLSRFEYEYDELGQVSTLRTAAGTWSYTYDPVGRLTRAAFDAVAGADTDITYAYDAFGNRVQAVVDGTPTDYATNIMNQYTTAGTATFAYDADGDLISATDGTDAWTFGYDATNRLVSAQHGGDSWTFTYDAFGFRSGVTKNGVTRTYLHDPTGLGNVVAEFDGSGALVRRHIHADGLAASFDGGGNAFYPMFDLAGNLSELVDENGAAVNTYRHAPFGERLEATEAVQTPFVFAGETGSMTDDTGLVFMRNRYYMPSTGRFITLDTPRESIDNRYAYASNMPTMLIDPLGLEPAFHHVPETVKRHLREIIEYERQHGTADTLAAFNPTWFGERNGHFFKTTIMTDFGRVDMDWFLTMAHFNSVAGKVGATSGAIVGGIGGGIAGAPAGPAGIAVGIAKGGSVGALAGWAVVLPAFTYWPAKLGWALMDRADRWNHLQAIGNHEELIAINMANMIHGGFSIESVFENYGIAVGSKDPNQKTGPAGYGSGNWLPGDRLFAYRIDFENDSEATAPAQVITITDPLDANLDWSTFEITEIGFSDQLVTVPAHLSTYETTIPFEQSGEALDVQARIALNQTTGRIEVLLATIDPATGLPPSADLGFLLPEDGSGRGQGHLSFVVRPRAGLASGTEIRNVAVITFDFGEVIATNQVDPHNPGAGTDPTKEALVTLDAGAPSSAVAALPALSLPGFLVSWAGTDLGAGIVTYTIYVQDNGGPFTPWLTDTALTEEVYAGVAGHTYAFYSIATDAVGWRESAKTAAEATTSMAYTVSFGSGPNGSLTGTTTQYLAAGGSASAVTAVPAEGYGFRRWAQGATEYSTENPLTVTPVNADLTLTAEFEISTHTLTYSAGPHGSIVGPTPQAVDHGSDGATVSAVPDTGYHFVQWSDGVQTAARTDTHVTAALTVAASFAINQYTLTYSAGPHGFVAGATPQTVDHGASGTAVTATPDAGYRFVQWSDGVMTATRTATNVTADLTVAANFAVNQHTLTYSAGPHGSIAGPTPQTVSHEGDGTAVQALPDEGYVFVQWSDTSTANPRTDTDVIADLAVTAEFGVAGGVTPTGSFLARIGAAGVTAGRGLWDLTGAYATRLGTTDLALNLAHDRRGRLTGTAILQIDAGKGLVPVDLPIKGSTRGSGGALLASLLLQGTDATRTVKVSLALSLTLDVAALQLHGPVTGSLMVNGVSSAVPDSVTLDLPAGMDGTWTVLFDLDPRGSGSVTGTALLTLANGVDYLCTAKGRVAGQGAVLTLTGHPSDPPASAVRIRTTIETLEGGQARLRTLSGNAYGQALEW